MKLVVGDANTVGAPYTIEQTEDGLLIQQLGQNSGGLPFSIVAQATVVKGKKQPTQRVRAWLERHAYKSFPSDTLGQVFIPVPKYVQGIRLKIRSNGHVPGCEDQPPQIVLQF